MIMKRAAWLFALFALLGAGSAVTAPSPSAPPPAPDLEALLPTAFGDWREARLSHAVLPAEVEIGAGESVAYRAYRDQAGRVATLVLAYGPPLGDTVRLHRPETCYRAQGYAIANRRVMERTLAGRAAPVVDLEAEKALKGEAVSYVLRQGENYALDPGAAQRLRLARAIGLAPGGRRDGVLLRVSSHGDGETAFAFNHRFLSAFAQALEPDGQALIFAAAP